MNFDIELLRACANGACRVEKVEESGGGFGFYRFTEEQVEAYKYNPDFYKKTFSTPCINLNFKTNSTSLTLEAETFSGTSRTFFAFDLLVDGKLVDYMGNIEKLGENYDWSKCDLGSYSRRFELGKGEKEVKLVFPFSVKSIVKTVAVDDGAYVTPIKAAKKMVLFGDSITHGYDAAHPTNSYAFKLSEHLGVQGFNKAIGADMFFPQLATLPEEFTPDYITVAYGTNDWNVRSAEAFRSGCKGFFENLRRTYPAVKIFAILPIWRKDLNDPKAMTFDEARRFIEDTARENEIIPIDTIDFIPHDSKYFSDGFLHPNDEGFDHYFEGLKKEIDKYI